jgi:hypothetical protein
MKPRSFKSRKRELMDNRLTALERAFHLARSGEVSTITEIVGSLRRDGYSTNQLDGPALRRQLKGLIMAARPQRKNTDRI